MNIDVTTENLKFFQCFSSKKKIKIIELIAESPRNIGELAKLLDVSSTIVTRHVKALEDTGIVTSSLVPGKRGQQKLCSLALKNATLHFLQRTEMDINQTVLSIPVGQFTSHKVEPTCGMASKQSYIGMLDDPRYFNSPARDKAEILWFQSGHITYTIPGYLFDRPADISALTISLEICSEYPGFNNDFPSDIHFYLNDLHLGFWTSPGNFGDRKGTCTPGWFTCGTEYGLLKNIIINDLGTYIDGTQLSTITLKDLDLNSQTNLNLRIASPQNVEHPGGVTIFGKEFGNYAQDIKVTVIR